MTDDFTSRKEDGGSWGLRPGRDCQKEMQTLKYAIQMELDAERYYMAQAELNKGNSLEKICRILAGEEHHHAQILEKKMQDEPYQLAESVLLEKVRNVFADLEAFKSEIKAIPSQLDFYRMAAEKERESIELYRSFLATAATEEEKGLFRFLIQQETDHYTTLDELATLLEHAEEWVESAEFGLRQDY